MPRPIHRHMTILRTVHQSGQRLENTSSGSTVLGKSATKQPLDNGILYVYNILRSILHSIVEGY
jgi:hypothetical protein